MSKILLLSNGHGEDLSGSLLANYLVKKGDCVEALPIVGDGENYKKVNSLKEEYSMYEFFRWGYSFLRGGFR